MSERLSGGVINQTTTLQYQFTKDGKAYDAYLITKIEIYDDYDKAITGDPGDVIETIQGSSVTKVDTGLYQWDVAPIATYGIYYDKIYLIPDDGEDTWTDIERFNIAPDNVCPGGETRKGYAFNNPDFTANGNWGAIITPDELRYVYAFGNELIAPNAQTITDDTLKWYIDNAVGYIEKDLKIKILKKVYK